LDFKENRALRDVLLDIDRTRQAVLVSSHHLAELEDTCTSVLFMRRGSVERYVRLDQDDPVLTAEFVVEDGVALGVLAKRLPPTEIGDWALEGRVLRGNLRRSRLADMVAWLVHHGIRIEAVRSQGSTIGEIFREIEEGE